MNPTKIKEPPYVLCLRELNACENTAFKTLYKLRELFEQLGDYQLSRKLFSPWN